MNAQSVWPGHEYAYVSYVRKQHFPTGAIKVKVISLRKARQYGKERVDTLCTVQFDGGATREVNVRNLYDFWDSYTDEKEHREIEQQRRREENERHFAEMRERRIREAEERAAAEKAEADRKRMIADNLADRLGLDRAAVETAFNGVVIGYNHLRFLED